MCSVQHPLTAQISASDTTQAWAISPVCLLEIYRVVSLSDDETLGAGPKSSMISSSSCCSDWVGEAVRDRGVTSPIPGKSCSPWDWLNCDEGRGGEGRKASRVGLCSRVEFDCKEAVPTSLSRYVGSTPSHAGLRR